MSTRLYDLLLGAVEQGQAPSPQLSAHTFARTVQPRLHLVRVRVRVRVVVVTLLTLVSK